MGEGAADLKITLRSLHVKLSKQQYDLDVKPLLKVIFSKFFGKNFAFVDMIMTNVPSPKEISVPKMMSTYSGNVSRLLDIEVPENPDQKKDLTMCDSSAPLVVQVVKLIAYKRANKRFFVQSDQSGSADKSGNEFLALGRIFSGVVRQDDKVKVLGEKFRAGVDEEDQAVCEVKKLFLPLGRHYLPVSHLPAGNWVLIQGVDHVITKTATIVSPQFHSSNPVIKFVVPFSNTMFLIEKYVFCVGI